MTLSVVLLAARMGRVWIVALMSVMIVLMNICVLKQMTLFGLTVTGGNVLYASVFLCTDLLAEHWGKREARQAVMVGFFSALVFLFTSNMILLYQPNDFDFANGALETLFAPQWRIIGASLTTYLVVQHLDIWLYEFWRRKTAGKMLWLRNNASTWFSQAIDTVMFTSLAFIGMEGFSGETIMSMIVFTYIIKIIIAALDTPFIYLSKTPLLKPRDAALD